MGFWNNFWGYVKKKIEEYDGESKRAVKIQEWEDIKHYSPLAIANAKLTSLACDEATIELETDSSVAEVLKPLVEDLEARRYEICSMMNGKGGCFVTMATSEDDEAYHRIISPADVSVRKMSGKKMREVAMIIDKKIVKDREYRLIRHHVLEDNGTLYIYYYTTDKDGKGQYLEEWEHFKEDNTAYLNANNIGVAYFKSPQDSRGISPVWGVPLNFGCEEEEAEIKNDREALRGEMKKAAMKLFVDKSITRVEHTENGERYDLPEDVYVIQKKAGVDGGLIDEFAPSTRYNDFKAKLDNSKAEWEDIVGLDRGFLTEAERTAKATATEVKTANVKTRSFVKKIQAAMYDGILAAITADAVFLDVSTDLWAITVDWFDAFEDEDAQYERLANAVDRGVAEKDDEMQWLFPNLTPEERFQKLARIESSKSAAESNTLDNIINGGA